MGDPKITFRELQSSFSPSFSLLETPPMSWCLLRIAVFQLLLVLGSFALECYNVNTTTHRQVDVFGRERYFHGVNVVVKGPPWIPETTTFDPQWSFTEKDMDFLNSLGLNTIRFGMMWPGVEPTKDNFNETYITIAKDIISRCAKYNITVILDMHQDVYNPLFCGEGFPDWTVDTESLADFPEPLSRTFGLNNRSVYPSNHVCLQHAWAEYQFTFAVNAAYQDVYSNKSGLLDQLADFWGKVAEEFKDFTNVLGYELINEPWAGDIYHDPLLLIPKEADKKNFAHVYDVISDKIRAQDTCHNIFFEPLTFDITTTGFDHVPGGQAYSNRSVLSYHFYVPPQLSVWFTFTERRKDIERLSCAGFLTEFNMNGLNSPDVDTMNSADEFLQSWTGWDYKAFYDKTGDSGAMWFKNGSLNEDFANVMSRTYASAVAGVTQKMSFDTSSHTFTLSYKITSACHSTATEIYLNEALHYPNGYSVAITPKGEASYRSTAQNHLEINHSVNLKEGTVVTAIITKA